MPTLLPTTKADEESRVQRGVDLLPRRRAACTHAGALGWDPGRRDDGKPCHEMLLFLFLPAVTVDGATTTGRCYRTRSRGVCGEVAALADLGGPRSTFLCVGLGNRQHAKHMGRQMFSLNPIRGALGCLAPSCVPSHRMVHRRNQANAGNGRTRSGAFFEDMAKEDSPSMA